MSGRPAASCPAEGGGDPDEVDMDVLSERASESTAGGGVLGRKLRLLDLCPGSSRGDGRVCVIWSERVLLEVGEI
jgi:hypothetical protein